MKTHERLCPACHVCPLDSERTDKKTRIDECSNCGYRARMRGGRVRVLAAGDGPSLALGSGHDPLEEADALRLDDLCYEGG